MSKHDELDKMLFHGRFNARSLKTYFVYFMYGHWSLKEIDDIALYNIITSIILLKSNTSMKIDFLFVEFPKHQIDV